MPHDTERVGALIISEDEDHIGAFRCSEKHREDKGGKIECVGEISSSHEREGFEEGFEFRRDSIRRTASLEGVPIMIGSQIYSAKAVGSIVSGRMRISGYSVEPVCPQKPVIPESDLRT